MADFEIYYDGQPSAIVLFEPRTPRAQRWMRKYVVSEPWQWAGPALRVDFRMAHDLLEGIEAAGLSYERANIPTEE